MHCFFIDEVGETSAILVVDFELVVVCEEANQQ